MLKFLLIENFALIDHLEIEFQKGFNLITGEALGGPVSKPIKIYDVKIENENIFIKSN